jgi:hypothetical protein
MADDRITGPTTWPDAALRVAAVPKNIADVREG